MTSGPRDAVFEVNEICSCGGQVVEFANPGESNEIQVRCIHCRTPAHHVDSGELDPLGGVI